MQRRRDQSSIRGAAIAWASGGVDIRLQIQGDFQNAILAIEIGGSSHRRSRHDVGADTGGGRGQRARRYLLYVLSRYGSAPRSILRQCNATANKCKEDGYGDDRSLLPGLSASGFSVDWDGSTVNIFIKHLGS